MGCICPTTSNNQASVSQFKAKLKATRHLDLSQNNTMSNIIIKANSYQQKTAIINKNKAKYQQMIKDPSWREVMNYLSPNELGEVSKCNKQFRTIAKDLINILKFAPIKHQGGGGENEVKILKPLMKETNVSVKSFLSNIPKNKNTFCINSNCNFTLNSCIVKLNAMQSNELMSHNLNESNTLMKLPQLVISSSSCIDNKSKKEHLVVNHNIPVSMSLTSNDQLNISYMPYLDLFTHKSIDISINTNSVHDVYPRHKTPGNSTFSHDNTPSFNETNNTKKNIQNDSPISAKIKAKRLEMMNRGIEKNNMTRPMENSKDIITHRNKLK